MSIDYNWEPKLYKFMESLSFKDKITAVVVCGSYVTGSPNEHSDLDVHFILSSDVDFRERGNKIVDGLLIEYFANPAEQIKKYFEEDLFDLGLMSQTQFATGKILKDDLGEASVLKEIATYEIKNIKSLYKFKKNPLILYGLWDKLDDLESLLKEQADNFDFVYFNNLNKLLEVYYKLHCHKYGTKIVFGSIVSDVVRNKYLLEEVEDEEAKTYIVTCIANPDQHLRLEAYRELTNKVMFEAGGFEIDGFKYRSDLDI